MCLGDYSSLSVLPQPTVTSVLPATSLPLTIPSSTNVGTSTSITSTTIGKTAFTGGAVSVSELGEEIVYYGTFLLCMNVIRFMYNCMHIILITCSTNMLYSTSNSIYCILVVWVRVWLIPTPAYNKCRLISYIYYGILFISFVYWL